MKNTGQLLSTANVSRFLFLNEMYKLNYVIGHSSPNNKRLLCEKYKASISPKKNSTRFKTRYGNIVSAQLYPN